MLAFRPPLLWLSLIQIAVLRLLAADDPAQLQTGWRNLAEFDVEEALRIFSAAADDPGEVGREARYGRAIALLIAQPKTAARIDESRQLMTQLRAENPNDQVGIAAWYYLARIEQVHTLDPPRYADAAALYRSLSEAHPKEWYGQMALLKLAIIDLTFGSAPDEREERVRAWAKRADEFTFPELARNFHRVLGWTYFFNRSEIPAKLALQQMQAAEELGFIRNDFQADMLIRVYRLAMVAGDREAALRAAEEFVQKFSAPRHYHYQLMLDNLQRLRREEALP